MEKEGFHRKMTTNLQCIGNGGKDLVTIYNKTILKYNYQYEINIQSKLSVMFDKTIYSLIKDPKIL